MASHSNNFSQREAMALCLKLLESVSTSPNHRVPVRDLTRELGVDAEELAQLLGIIEFLVDSNSGARAVLSLDGDCIALGGDAAQIDALRLNATTSSLLNAVLEQGGFDEEDEQRAMETLSAPNANPPASAIAQPSGPYGRFSAIIGEAIEDGVRCRLVYRSAGEAVSRPRIVDPHEVSSQEGRCYLVAWDVQKDAQRRYRMDFIEDFSLTADSVEVHPYTNESMRQSLDSQGAVATVRLLHASTARPVDWRNATELPQAEGAEGAEGAHPTSDSLDYRVAYGSETWLFDRILEAGGELVIVDPVELRQRFVEYATDLLA